MSRSRTPSPNEDTFSTDLIRKKSILKRLSNGFKKIYSPDGDLKEHSRPSHHSRRSIKKVTSENTLRNAQMSSPVRKSVPKNPRTSQSSPRISKSHGPHRKSRASRVGRTSVTPEGRRSGMRRRSLSR